MRLEFKEHAQAVKKISECFKSDGVMGALKFIDDMGEKKSLAPGYVWQLKASLYSRAKMSGKEVSCYTKALETDDDHIGLYFLRGRAFYKFKLYHKAIEDFTQGLILTQEQLDLYFEPILYFYRAHSFFELGHYNNALEDLEHVPFDYSGWTDDLRSKDDLLRVIERRTTIPKKIGEGRNKSPDQAEPSKQAKPPKQPK